ncbi:MAG: serine/threonine protein kinase, partial [Candidatus Zixiibacteriota bacterium]
GHTGNVYSLAFTTDGTRLASCSGDLTIRLWDVAGGKQLKELKGHQGYVYGLAVSPSSHLMATSDNNYRIKLWDLDKLQEIRTFEVPYEYVFSVAFSPDGRYLVSRSRGRGSNITIWGIPDDTVTNREK